MDTLHLGGGPAGQPPPAPSTLTRHFQPSLVTADREAALVPADWGRRCSGASGHGVRGRPPAGAPRAPAGRPLGALPRAGRGLPGDGAATAGGGAAGGAGTNAPAPHAAAGASGARGQRAAGGGFGGAAAGAGGAGGGGGGAAGRRAAPAARRPAAAPGCHAVQPAAGRVRRHQKGEGWVSSADGSRCDSVV